MTPVKRSPKETVPQDVNALRASLDLRLTALEEALANPAKHASLESLILDLARVATEEADATARQAALDAQRAGQSAIAAARSELLSALEAEKAAAASLRQALEKAQAGFKAERSAAEAANREVAAVRRELDAEREALEREQSNRTALGRELEAARASVETERARAASLEQTVERVRSEAQAGRLSIEAQQREIAAKVQEIAARHQALDRQLKEEQAAHAQTQTDRDQARATADAERLSAARLLETNIQLERDIEAIRGELTTARHELSSLRRDADARTETLSQSQAAQEQVLMAAQDAARAADARAEDAIREREALRKELESANEAIRERDALRGELDAAHEAIGDRNALSNELEAAREAARERDALRRELEAVRDVIRERDELRAALESAQEVIRERDGLQKELEAAHEQRDAARALYSGPQLIAIDEDEETVIDLTTDTKDEEMQRVIETRIRSLELALRDAETRAEFAELELDRHRRRARQDEAPALEPVGTAASEPPKEPVFRGPARGAKRVAITTEVDIQIDAAPGKLIDLSISGAQVLTSFAMKPNRLVTVTLPMGDNPIVCKAKVMWSRLEPKTGQLWYRAGVAFMTADQVALEAFLKSYRKEA